jgi:3-deoxy-D-manno-octulosonic-acid transferase
MPRFYVFGARGCTMRGLPQRLVFRNRMYFLYSVITAAGMLLLSPYFLIKGIRQKKYLSNLPERFAWRFPPELTAGNGSASHSGGAIWLHAVSVGEALAAVSLARAFKERFPDRRLVISTTTATGQAVARERLGFADAIFYFPFDWRGPVRRALRAARPEAIIVLETEIWPNFLREAHRAGVPVVFVNGRFSERSFRRLSRAVKFSGGLLRGFVSDVLNQAALFLMQSEEDRARLISLGASPERVVATGNLKYDLAPPGERPLVVWLSAELSRSGRGPLLVAGSVIKGEEGAVLRAFDKVAGKWPRAVLLIAPRKPERFDVVAEIIAADGWRVVRRSALSLGGAPNGSSANALKSSPGEPPTVLLLDSIGELAAVYGIADVVFVGGSLEPAGGHNPLEPASLGRAPVFGSSMDNFREISERLLEADAAIRVSSAEELGAAWTALLEDESRRARMGRAAKELVERHRGATAITIERIASVLAEKQAHG